MKESKGKNYTFSKEEADHQSQPNKRNSRTSERNEQPASSRKRKDSGRPFEQRKHSKEGKKPFAKYRHDSPEERPAPKKQAYAGKNFKKDYKKLLKSGVNPLEEREVDKRLRLNRYIANAGICSRREADQLIANGEIMVNNQIITEMGYRVNPGDQVKHKGKTISAEQKVYLLLNKPKGFVSTLDDPHAEKTVMDLVRNACPERIYPVGRLDKATTGLLLFTNDGELAKKLTHPSHQKKKIYHVFLKEEFPEELLHAIATGIELEDGIIKADAISYVDLADKSQVGIEIHSGKNRIVRRIFEHFGYRVQKLDRVFFAGLTKKNLPRGKYRFLTPQEVNFLKMN